ncbi:MAG TPA: glycosyltransferase family 4 protein [Candidatus Acidoferrum sp.]|nr:glycosyltransferase family 4 protein [Candidatus Acidoferrum sp.]
MIIGLFPELDSAGGIQRAGRHLAAVISEFAESRKMECRLLSLNDSPELHRMSVGDREFVFTGSERAKGRFAATALRSARRHAKLVVAGHPFLAPVAQGMRIAAPRMKSIVVAHGIEVWDPLSPLRRRALRRATTILTPTQDTADHVATQQQIPRDRIRVLPWALDPDFENLAVATAQSSLPLNYPAGRVILTVGRWQANERYKGMDTLITALPRLLQDWPDLQLVAVGDGDDRDWLEQMAKSSGVHGHVHFYTGLTSAELAACYSACEIFALPSRGEGFGLVYLEAMARGKPVIGGAHGGTPEVIDDGKTGYLVQHGDVPQLATSIETLLSDPALGREMGARGRERVNREFKFGVFAKSLKKILRELCES